MNSIAFVLTSLCPVIAVAHIMPDHAEPKAGATVQAAPTEVKIWFDGPVGVEKSAVAVTDAAGKSIMTGKLHGDEKDKTELIIPIAPSTGKITVKWDAYCPDCDHTTHGTYSFTVGE